MDCSQGCLSKLPKYFGGDSAETPTNAIITVVDAYDWRADALRVIILATDISAKTEKDSTKTAQVASMSETVSKCNEKQVSVNLVGRGEYNFAPILDGTGGAYQSSGNMLPIVQRIHDTPIVTTQPADCYTYEGSNVTFTAGSLAGKTVDYAWYYVKDGTQTVVESGTTNTDVTLTLSGVQKDISGQYFCRFTNTGSDTRTIETRYATLDVHTNFAITKQPADQRVEAGQLAAFAVAATGDDLTYQWQKLDGSAWVDLSGETNASLTISATVADNGTRYRCVIRDAISEQTGITLTSDPATLTVVAAPEITKQPQSLRVEAGQSAAFTVEATGDELVYQWQKHDGSEWISLPGETNASLTISKAVLREDGSTFRCLVCSSFGTLRTSNSVTLTVVAAPEITKQPADQRVEAGQSAAFTVEATGDELTYQWQKLDGSEWVDLPDETNASLTISAAALTEDGSTFRCVVCSSFGTALSSDPAELTVVAAPEITKQPQSLRVNAGKSAVFTVEATGDELTYQWQKLDGSKWVDLPGETNASLTISAAALTEDGSTFHCVVRSSFGTALSSDPATLTVEELTNLAVTGDSALLWLWAALLVVSGTGIAATAVYGRKRRAK